MAEVTWSPEALHDIESIKSFVASDSPHYAGLVAQRLVSAVERLMLFPESGRVVPEFNDSSLREVVWRGCRPRPPKWSSSKQCRDNSRANTETSSSIAIGWQMDTGQPQRGGCWESPGPFLSTTSLRECSLERFRAAGIGMGRSVPLNWSSGSSRRVDIESNQAAA